MEEGKELVERDGGGGDISEKRVSESFFTVLDVFRIPRVELSALRRS